MISQNEHPHLQKKSNSLVQSNSIQSRIVKRIGQFGTEPSKCFYIVSKEKCENHLIQVLINSLWLLIWWLFTINRNGNNTVYLHISNNFRFIDGIFMALYNLITILDCFVIDRNQRNLILAIFSLTLCILRSSWRQFTYQRTIFV